MEQSIIDKVLEQVDIVDIIQNYIPLTKKGKSYLGLCPFHEDTNPSLSVSKEKRIYKCFTCNEGGNAISFIQKMEHCDFKTAYNKLIELAGLNEDWKMKIVQEPTYDPYDEKQKRQIEMNDSIQKYLEYRLHTNMEKSLDYVRERGLQDDCLKKFGIGYLDDIKPVINFLEKKFGFTVEEMKMNDFFRYNERGLFSPFEHRITIPIFDRYNHLIGFAGRKAYAETFMDGKYINPSTTELFEKSKVLYNLYHARNALRSKKALYIVEGYMDVVAMTINSYDNCVALMGTALTQEHINQLKQLKDKDIVFVLDGDKAGQASMFRIYAQSVEAGLDAKFVCLPEGRDPDDLFRSDKEKMDVLLSSYHYGYEFALDYCKQHPEPSFMKQKEQMKLMLDLFSRQQRDAFDLAHLTSMMTEVYDIDRESIKAVYSEIVNIQKQKTIREMPQDEAVSRYGTRTLRGVHR